MAKMQITARVDSLRRNAELNRECAAWCAAKGQPMADLLEAAARYDEWADEVQRTGHVAN